MAEPQWSEDSFYRKEQRKWDTPKRAGGMNANGFEEYPRMLYKAQFNPISGKNEALLQRDVISADKTTVILSAEQFNTSCQVVVQNAEERDRAREDGWRDSPAEAMAFHNETLDNVAREAAERAYRDRNMGEKAKAEAAEVEASTHEQVAEIPVAKRGPGRPRNVA